MCSLLALFANSSAMHRSRAAVKVSSLTAYRSRGVLDILECNPDASLSRRSSSKKAPKLHVEANFFQLTTKSGTLSFSSCEAVQNLCLSARLLEPVRSVLAESALNPRAIYCSGSLGHIDSLTTCKLVVQPLLGNMYSSVFGNLVCYH